MIRANCKNGEARGLESVIIVKYREEGEIELLASGKIWGIKSQERLLTFPCDRHMGVFDDTYYRGITIHANQETIYRWLCQMRIAPYSYDWIDNFGRRSPQTLIPGLDKLAVGQKIMFIFELVDFEPNRHLTIRINKDIPFIFGDTIISYLIIPESQGISRLVVKLVVRYPKGLLGMLMRAILPWGDLIMMRRQLLNFKKLSEQIKKRHIIP